MSDAKIQPSTYFKFANPFVAAIIIFGMALCHLGCYSPHTVPDQYMGPLGWLYRFLVYSHPWAIQVIYHSAVVVHVLEAFYAMKLMNSKGITDPWTKLKWFLQNLLLGIGSVYFLIKFSTDIDYIAPDMHKTTSSSATYFKFANPFIAASVISGMALCHLGCYSPHIVPDRYMGPLGWLYHFLVYSHPWAIQVIYHSGIVSHIYQALNSLQLMKEKGITDPLTKVKWFLQVLILGVGSTYFLTNCKLKKS